MRPAKDPSDADLEREWVRACRRGDREAFRRLFDRYREPVLRLAYRYTGNADESEDAAQEIFVRVFERIDSFRFESSFSTWLYRLAIRHCLNRCRTLRPASRLDDLHDEPEGGENPASVALRREREGDALNAVAGLPENLKVVFLLVGVEGCSYVETAEILGVRVDAVRMRMSRARRELKARLIDEGSAL